MLKVSGNILYNIFFGLILRFNYKLNGTEKVRLWRHLENNSRVTQFTFIFKNIRIHLKMEIGKRKKGNKEKDSDVEVERGNDKKVKEWQKDRLHFLFSIFN